MWELLGGLFVWTIIGGVVPIVNAELMVVVTTLAVSAAAAPAIAVVAALGQMIAKTSLFFAARWAPAHLPERARAALGKGSNALQGRRGTVGLLIFVSAVAGLPPFYGVSLAAGALGVPWPGFVVLGTLGRAIRFGGLAWAATAFGEIALDFVE